MDMEKLKLFKKASFQKGEIVFQINNEIIIIIIIIDRHYVGIE